MDIKVCIFEGQFILLTFIFAFLAFNRAEFDGPTHLDKAISILAMPNPLTCNFMANQLKHFLA